MKFEKAPEWVVTTFDAALQSTPGERRQMFGYPTGFTRGHMFCGVFARQIFVRLGEADQAALLAVEGAAPFAPMEGHVMRGYIVVPAEFHDDAKILHGWFARAFAFAETLPPKGAKKKTKASAPPKPGLAKAKAAKKPTPKPKASKKKKSRGV